MLQNHKISSEQLLRRSVLSCMLWEDTFYESGSSIKERIEDLCNEVDAKIVASLAIEAREKFKLRSVPLLLVKQLASTQRGTNLVSKVLSRVIQRPDEMVKFLNLYWEDGKKPLSAQVKKGLALAFNKFDAYQLSKWNNNSKIDLRDIMFLTHPKPKDTEQAVIFSKLANKTLESPDTWEVRLSSGADKKQSWEDLLTHNKMGALAVLRNLRNFQRDGVMPEIIKQALNEIKIERILPYRFITAEKYAKEYSKELENAMMKCLSSQQKLYGKTILVVDVSGSMDWPLGYEGDLWGTKYLQKEQTNRIDVANGLAILLREICDDVDIYSFSDNIVRIEPARGFTLGDEIKNSQKHNGTDMGKAMKYLQNNVTDYDRLIVFTDEQSQTDISFYQPINNAYMVNVASYQYGIGYDRDWIRVHGFSDAVIEWIQQYEVENKNGWRTTIEEILFSGF